MSLQYRDQIKIKHPASISKSETKLQKLYTTLIGVGNKNSSANQSINTKVEQKLYYDVFPLHINHDCIASTSPRSPPLKEQECLHAPDQASVEPLSMQPSCPEGSSLQERSRGVSRQLQGGSMCSVPLCMVLVVWALVCIIMK